MTNLQNTWIASQLLLKPANLIYTFHNAFNNKRVCWQLLFVKVLLWGGKLSSAPIFMSIISSVHFNLNYWLIVSFFRWSQHWHELMASLKTSKVLHAASIEVPIMWCWSFILPLIKLVIPRKQYAQQRSSLAWLSLPKNWIKNSNDLSLKTQWHQVLILKCSIA